MSIEKIILIIATSGRLLAQMVKDVGYSPIVIDCYADQDTQILAIECIKVNSLALKFIKPAFSTLQAKYSLKDCLYGSGFDSNLDSLTFIQKNISVIGNSVEVFSIVQNKALFFKILKKNAIPHPVTLFSPPNDPVFLSKPIQGEGGIGIKQYQPLEKTKDCYWQKKIKGIPLSVLFVANGKQCKILGFHRLLVRGRHTNDYVFSGLIRGLNFSDELKNKISHWVNILVPEFSLKGLNSMDFIWQDEQCFVLEINPRPSASMQLYPSSIIEAHIDSCLSGELKPAPFIDSDYYAYQIIFAISDCVIKTEMNWPEWVIDIPQAGSIIHTGMPICSIIASKKSEQQLKDLLLLRRRLIYQILK